MGDVGVAGRTAEPPFAGVRCGRMPGSVADFATVRLGVLAVCGLSDFLAALRLDGVVCKNTAVSMAKGAGDVRLPFASARLQNSDRDAIAEGHCEPSWQCTYRRVARQRGVCLLWRLRRTGHSDGLVPSRETGETRIVLRSGRVNVGARQERARGGDRDSGRPRARRRRRCGDRGLQSASH